MFKEDLKFYYVPTITIQYTRTIGALMKKMVYVFSFYALSLIKSHAKSLNGHTHINNTLFFGVFLSFPCLVLRVCFFHNSLFNMSRVMRKPAFCTCENKDADQLRGNREADQRLCFRYKDSTIPILPKYESFWPACVVVQPGLCQTWSETTKTVFSNKSLFNFCSINEIGSK